MGESLEVWYLKGGCSKTFWRDWCRWKHTAHANVHASNRSRIPHHEGYWYSNSPWSFSNEDARGPNKTKYLLLAPDAFSFPLSLSLVSWLFLYTSLHFLNAFMKFDSSIIPSLLKLVKQAWNDTSSASCSISSELMKFKAGFLKRIWCMLQYT